MPSQSHHALLSAAPGSDDAGDTFGTLDVAGTTSPAVRHGLHTGVGDHEPDPVPNAPADVAQRLADLARQLRRQDTPQQVMDRIVTAATALVPGAQQATISRVRRRQQVTSSAATSEQARAFDEAQTAVGQGPCLEALFEARTVRVSDLTDDERWPRLAQHADELGVRSTLCFQLYVDGDNLGALNLLSAQPNAFDDESVEVGGLLASHAAVAVADAEELANVRFALDSRDLIGQAKGILMARHRLTADQAFAVLTRFSQDTNRKLRDVAEEVASTGHLPD